MTRKAMAVAALAIAAFTVSAVTVIPGGPVAAAPSSLTHQVVVFQGPPWG
jgi:hypothetical protein